jgi:acyl-coenzyme A synthetase/AMP-(fatty) acid ligase
MKITMSNLLGKHIAWWQGQSISRALFHAHVSHVAATLPQQAYVINLCEDRYLFMVAFAAALVRGQTNLLPPSRANMEIQRIASDYSESYCLTERHIAALPLTQHIVSLPEQAPLDNTGSILEEIAPEHIAAIVFTSGSTGQPRPHIKRWRTLVATSRLLQKHFNIHQDVTIVATVPPQHMYGLESSILLPLVIGVSVHGGRPFFPNDICEALAAVPAARVLITAPVHLDACVKAGLQWPEIECIISATAPLSKTLAAQAEAVCHTRVLEIYGCTEGGSLAIRRTLKTDIWHLYDGIHISEDKASFVVHSDHFSEQVILSDQIKIHSKTKFELLGRHTDMVNIAGKRTSLADLNHKLNAISGVEDGVFIMPEETEKRVTRLAALVVAPELDERTILAALAEHLDPAFLPRPLYKVNSLPRNETGKLPRRALLAQLRQFQS